MAELVIRDEHLAWQLFDIAQRENRSVEAVLESLLAEHYPKSSNDEPSPGSFAALNLSAQKAGIGRDAASTDTSERSREILETEYADYLKRRMDEQSNSD
ncbi:MAG: hypothetical protein ABI690_22270 [Chloroflexota bacterium]